MRVPWVLAYRYHEKYSFTVAEEPFSQAQGVRLSLALAAYRSRDLAVVYAQYVPDTDRAWREVEMIDAMTEEGSQALITRHNPQWLDYIHHFPERLRHYGGDSGGSGAGVREPGSGPQRPGGNQNPLPPEDKP